MAAAEAKRPVSVEAAEVPTGRTAAERLFRSAGWRAARTLTLLKRPVPNDAPTEPQPARPHRRTVSLRDSGLDAAGAAAAIASLYRGLDPGAAAGFAEQTLERWSRDRRFDPAGVLLVFEGPSPVAMALAWPLAHAGPEEEAEVLVTDVAATDVDHAFVLKQAAIHAALARGRDVGARVARAVVRPGEESEPFLRAGFAAVADAVVFRWSPDAEGAA
jgi:hypothetical protein